ncbi:MAG: sulfatase [Nitrospirae bacterium]|nr:sulfatase [Nitrospirota bacterium]
MRTMFLRCALLAAAAAVFSLGCGGREDASGKPPRSGRPNVIVVLVDTLRKDHLGCYGYRRDTSPFIDRLAGEGLLFENAVSQAPWTAPSMASMFSSRYPFQLGAGVKYEHGGKAVRGDKVHGLPAGAASIAEVFHDGGYATACITGNPFLKGTEGEKKGDKHYGKDFGMSRGFDKTRYIYFAKADKMFGAAREYIDGLRADTGGQGRPFFLHLQMMDLHSPTSPPAPFDSKFMPLDPSKKKLYYDWKYSDGKGLGTAGFRDFRDHKVSFYDGGLAFLDSELAKFVDYLKKGGLYEDTVIVIASDHGEEFWEHAVFETKYMRDLGDDYYGCDHGRTLFRELLDVPLIFHGPGVPAGRVRDQVRNIDIMPSLLGLAGLPVKPGSLEGTDIVSAVRDGAIKDMPAFSEQVVAGFEKKSIQSGGYKYIMVVSPGRDGFLYDKAGDPMEADDISSRRPDMARKLRSEIEAFVMEKEKSVSGLKKAEAAEMSEATKKQLKALGYLH